MAYDRKMSTCLWYSLDYGTLPLSLDSQMNLKERYCIARTTVNGNLRLQEILLFFHLAYDFIAVTPEVAASGSAVFLPRLQTDPAEVIFALRIPHMYIKCNIS